MGADNQSRESTLKEAMTTDQNTFWLIIGIIGMGGGGGGGGLFGGGGGGGGGGCLLTWGTGVYAAVYDFSSQQKAGPLLNAGWIIIMINNKATLSKSIKINVKYN